MKSLILATAARLLIGLFLTFSLFMLLRGHNSPGGGFIGGLIAAMGFVLLVFATSVAEARAALRFDPRDIGAAGLALAVLSGLASAFTGKDPFTGIWPDLGGLPISSVLFFDVGVYLAVFGAILTLVFALEDSE